MTNTDTSEKRPFPRYGYFIWERSGEDAEYQTKDMLDQQRVKGWRVAHVIEWNYMSIKLIMEKEI
jgi:nicotinamide riboside transporter PnuC